MVVGAGRTGTSVVAKVLQERMGVDMGGPGVVRGATPDGDWEDPVFADLSWKTWGGEISQSEWKRRAKREARKRVEPWGVKHPVFSEFLPLVLATFPNAVFVWCKRDPLDTWQSWLRRFSVAPEEAWVRVNYRHWAIQAALINTPHMSIDTTHHLEEEEIARALGEAIELLRPGTLQV